MAKVATSAVEGMELGYIRKTENISLNRDQQLWDAKQVVLGSREILQETAGRS